jgi:hypothetical protein
VVLKDHRRGLLWRVAAVGTAVVLVVLWKSGVRDPSYVLQIQFGNAPDILAGAEVVIDDSVVGSLKREGARTVSGFRVEEGDHTAKLRLPGCTSETARFTSGFGGALVTLMWYPDITARGSESVCVLRLER